MPDTAPAPEISLTRIAVMTHAVEIIAAQFQN
jgi:hypothetical protein